MRSTEIKLVARKQKVALWRIADKLSVSESTILRWLRHDLPSDKQQRILNAINEIVGERTQLNQLT